MRGNVMTRKRAQSHAQTQNVQNEQDDKRQASPSGSHAAEDSVTMNSERDSQTITGDGAPGDQVAQANGGLPPDLNQQAGQVDQLVAKLEQQLTQAMQPVLNTLLQEITETARQQIEPALEPVRRSLQQQVDKVLQPIHETLHQEVDKALQPVRETLQHEMDTVLQPVREIILQQVEVVLRSSFKQPSE